MPFIASKWMLKAFSLLLREEWEAQKHCHSGAACMDADRKCFERSLQRRQRPAKAKLAKTTSRSDTKHCKLFSK